MKINEAEFLKLSDVRLLDTAQVISYLQSRGWTERVGAGRGLLRIFYRENNRLMEASVPVSKGDDNGYVLARSIYVISKYEGRSQTEVYSDLLFFTDDVLVVREVSPEAINGTLTFDRAIAMFAGIRKSLLSVAHLEIDPHPYYQRQTWADAERFMEQCRFGQTGIGSYIMTVTCPLNAISLNSKLNDGSPLYEAVFTRRVTHRLLTSVRALIDGYNEVDHASAIVAVSKTDEKEKMLSANLCEALLELAPSSPGASLEIGVRWARRSPFDNEREPASTVSLNANHINFIEAVGARLKTIVVPDAMQSFSGRIDTLDGRANSAGIMEGAVYSRMLDDNGDARRVRIDLDESDYQEAADAHKANLLVLIRGKLKRTGSSGFRIESYRDFQVIKPTISSAN